MVRKACSCAVLTTVVAAPLLAGPPSDAEPASLDGRLAESVERAVLPLESSMARVTPETFEVRLVDPESGKKRRFESLNPWNAVMPGLFAFLEEEPARAETFYFVDVLERAIEAHMTTLGEIEWELDRAGSPDPATRIAPHDPRESGLIRVPPVGAFRDIAIHFRAMVEQDSGDIPGVLVMFRYAPEGTQQPQLCRLIIPQDGARPLFFRTVPDPATGGATVQTRTYGEVPRLIKTRSVLEAWVAGQWVRPPNDWQQYLVDEPLHPEAAARAAGRQRALVDTASFADHVRDDVP